MCSWACVAQMYWLCQKKNLHLTVRADAMAVCHVVSVCIDDSEGLNHPENDMMGFLKTCLHSLCSPSVGDRPVAHCYIWNVIHEYFLATYSHILTIFWPQILTPCILIGSVGKKHVDHGKWHGYIEQSYKLQHVFLYSYVYFKSSGYCILHSLDLASSERKLKC